ncbi:nucleoside recognition domain-containing protein [Halostagnicola sp. A-GB9-2]|uniref:YjiH family protein n=1 Tax=Halostagnicola sp. A-GB9-2 TaxID=3048066 RepID=UPI0024BFCBDE|nr:nucleoside recognition domain-containing protein [Halostagnicola sp. A-GB9-2]MDJ1434083.1 YjiH family protein [Halostagnicola sp. A-GB9-2]
MFGSNAWEDDDHISEESVDPESKTIEDIDLIKKRFRPTAKFIAAFTIGAFFFLFPMEWDGQTTIPLDVVVTIIQDAALYPVEVFTFLLIAAGGLFTTISMAHYQGIISLDQATVDRLELDYWKTSNLFWALRVFGIVVAIPILFRFGPEWLLSDATSGVVWGALLLTIALVIPIGAIFVNLLAELGGLQFVGTLAQPIMKPAFNLPGRAALDGSASWLGSFSIGYYLTRNVFDRGGYNKREVFVICSCFATANLGTVGAIAAVLGILHVFPVVVALYLLSVLITAAILVRVPPLSTIPDEFIAEPDPEPVFTGSVPDYFRFAFNEAVKTAEQGSSITRAAVVGLIDGMKLTAMMLGTILSIGMGVVLLNEYTAFFELIAIPLIPVMTAFGIPDPQLAASAIIIGGAEMFIAATLVVGAETITQVFIVIVVSSQAIFFAASAPMMVDMFDDIPIRFRDLFVLFVQRTIVLIPVAAALTHGAAALGML